MNEQWDFYLCRIDGKPASIRLDLGLINEAPIAGHGYLASIVVMMLAPRVDGLSSQVEAERLGAVEDALATQLAESYYAGCLTCEGRSEFYFYLPTQDELAARVTKAMAAFSEYEYTSEVREDLEWEVYLEFLYPDEAGRHSISNRHVCGVLERNGDVLEKPREIDHWAYFPDAAARATFIERAQALGYQLREMWGPDEEVDAYAVRVYRDDTPSYDNIDHVTHGLLFIAEELGGEYDGWECAVVGEEMEPARTH